MSKKEPLKDLFDHIKQFTDEEFDLFIHTVFEYMPEKDKIILRHRYQLDGYKFMTLKELGDYFGVTLERIRQREKWALIRMRSALRKYLISSDVNDIATRVQYRYERRG